jgi:hypothetical protein
LAGEGHVGDEAQPIGETVFPGDCYHQLVHVGDRVSAEHGEGVSADAVEVEGGGKTKGSLKSKQGADKSSSISKATKILNTLESTEDKKTKIVSEEMNKMKNLISYDRKTQ